MRVISILGARPQFVKAAVLSRALQECGIQEILVHTGQHHDIQMSEVFFKELALPSPSFNLGIHGGSHGEMTGRMLEAIEKILVSEAPDKVLVAGDTNSTLAGALAAVKLHIPVAHVEAGLRSFNRRMPEELNRTLTDHVSAELFCPTRAAVSNLEEEGIREGVHLVGDVMLDLVLAARPLALRNSRILEYLKLQDGDFALATIHRAENTNDKSRLVEVISWLKDRARRSKVLLPLHPRTRHALFKIGENLENIIIIDPVGYLDMQRLLLGCTEVFTDSGGLQKEAYFHRKPCVTLRDETEWCETIECGWNRLWHNADYKPRKDIEEYGDGHAANRIAEILSS